MAKDTLKKRRRLNWKRVFFLLFFVIVFICGFSYLYQLPIKNISITGTTYLKDKDIIRLANIEHYPAIYRLNLGKIKKEIEGLSFVEHANIKRNIFGKLSIHIDENKVLFFNRNNNKLVLSNKAEIDEEISYVGIPTLINFVPDQIYVELVEKLSKLSDSILKSISEMEYAPSKSEDVTIDDTRFFFRMNDGNLVHINLIHMNHLENYQKICSTIANNKKGILYLDSSNDENFSFHAFEEPKKSE